SGARAPVGPTECGLRTVNKEGGVADKLQGLRQALVVARMPAEHRQRWREDDAAGLVVGSEPPTHLPALIIGRQATVGGLTRVCCAADSVRNRTVQQRQSDSAGAAARGGGPLGIRRTNE